MTQFIVSYREILFKSFSRGMVTTTRQFILTKDILNGSNQITLYLSRKRRRFYPMPAPALKIRWDALEHPIMS